MPDYSAAFGPANGFGSRVDQVAFYLFRLDDGGNCIADTWHQTVEAAKAQANFEYGIQEEDWRDWRH